MPNNVGILHWYFPFFCQSRQLIKASPIDWFSHSVLTYSSPLPQQTNSREDKLRNLNNVTFKRCKLEQIQGRKIKKWNIMYSNLRLLLHYKKYMQRFQVLNSSLTVFSKIVHCNYGFALNMFYFYPPPPPPPPPPTKKKYIYMTRRNFHPHLVIRTPPSCY